MNFEAATDSSNLYSKGNRDKVRLLNHNTKVGTEHLEKKRKV